jgi:hypothetical protein
VLFALIDRESDDELEAKLAEGRAVAAEFFC